MKQAKNRIIMVLTVAVVASAWMSVPSPMAAQGRAEDSSSSPDFQIIYTYRHPGSEVMTNLPPILRASGITDSDFTLSSWGGGHPCDREKMATLLRTDSPGTTVFTICHEDLLKYSGQFKPIPVKYINDENTPNLVNIFRQYASEFRAYSDGDALIALPGINVTYDLPTSLPILREDWIERVYGELSGPRIPLDSSNTVSFVDHVLTVEELQRILNDIRGLNLTPDGSSPVGAGRWHLTWPTLFGAFGLSTIWPSQGVRVTDRGIPNVLDDCVDEVLPNVMTCQYRKLVDLAATWYDNGLLTDQHFVADSGDDTLLAQLLNGDAATILSVPIVQDWDSVVANAREADRLQDGARLVILPPPLGLAQGTVRWRISAANGTFMAVSDDASNDQLEAALQVLDFVKLTPEGFVAEHYGVENIDYEWQGIEPYTGRPTRLEGAGEEAPYFPRYPRFLVPALYRVAFTLDSAKLIEKMSSERARDWALKPTYWWDRQNGEMDEAYSRIGPALNEFIERSFREMISGRRPASEITDSGSEFRERLADLGVTVAWDATRAGGIVDDG